MKIIKNLEYFYSASDHIKIILIFQLNNQRRASFKLLQITHNLYNIDIKYF